MKLYGKNPVLERIRANPGSIRKLFLQKKTDLSKIVKEAKASGLNFESVEKNEMLRLAGSVHSQGVIAEVTEYEYEHFERIIKECLKSGIVPVLIDSVTDPQNFGSIIRTLACLGGFSIVIPEHNSAEVNETVLRVANGGENYIRIARVKNLSPALTQLKEKGARSIGAVLTEDATSLHDTKLTFPLCIVIGSEGKGVRPGLVSKLDEKILLPMRGADLSFNVAIATALVAYEVKRTNENS